MPSIAPISDLNFFFASGITQIPLKMWVVYFHATDNRALNRAILKMPGGPLFKALSIIISNTSMHQVSRAYHSEIRCRFSKSRRAILCPFSFADTPADSFRRGRNADPEFPGRFLPWGAFRGRRTSAHRRGTHIPPTRSGR